MDFTLSKEHEMARTLFHDFAEKEVKPLAQEVDETEHFPTETVKKMQKLGFMGIPVPKEYGGQGCDPLCYAMCVEELSKVCGTTGVIVSAHTSLCCDPIQTYGTEEQKKRFLPKIAEEGYYTAFALTEPGAGSDPASAKTTAVYDPETDEYVLNGNKCFITRRCKSRRNPCICTYRPFKGSKGNVSIHRRKGNEGLLNRKDRRQDGYQMLRNSRAFL